MKQKEKHEFKPLLPSSMDDVPGHGKQTKPGFTNIQMENTAEDTSVLLKVKKGRNVSLVFADAIVLTLDFLQMFAVIQSMAMRWCYPKDWLQSSYFVFIFNLDIWEIMKLVKPNVYLSNRGYQIPSIAVSIKYEYILLLWLSLLLVISLVYILVYCILRFRRWPSFYVRFAQLQKLYLIFTQCLSLPVGLALFRLFLCSYDERVDVMYFMTCFKASHWGFLVPALLVLLLIFVVLPSLLFIKIWKESVSSNSKQHETFIHLKEAEYMYGLNSHWIVRKLFMFSSFKYWGTFYIPISFIIKLGVLIIYTAGFYGYETQPITAAVVFGLAFLFFLITRPFRIKIFNIMLIWNYLILFSFTILGSFIAHFDSLRIRSSWLLPPYSIYILAVLSSLWGIVWLLFASTLTIHLISKRFKCCRFSMTFLKDGLTLKPHTWKYIKALLKARQTLEKIKRMPCLFAPVHELVHQMHIVNGYYREAEFLQDPLHEALWELLDDLIEVHSRMAPKSVFSESVKESVRQTSFDLMKMMPTFARKVTQRDFDFILMSPLKKRLLLKMFCLATFINGREDKVARKKQFESIANRMWKPPPDEVELAESDGYYGDMYPEPLDIPDNGPFSNAALRIEMNDLPSEESSGDELTVLLENIKDIPEVKIPRNISRPTSAFSNKSSSSHASGRSSVGKTIDKRSGGSSGSIPGQIREDNDHGAADGSPSKREEVNKAFDSTDEQLFPDSRVTISHGSQISVKSDRNIPLVLTQVKNAADESKDEVAKTGKKTKQKHGKRKK